MKFIYLWFLVLFAYQNSITAQLSKETINVDVVYHFLYDTTLYNSDYLESDMAAFKLMNDAANLDLKGKIKLNLDPNCAFQFHHFPLSLYSLYTDYKYGRGDYVQSIIDKWSISGKINVFALRSITIEGSTLNGFTPILNPPIMFAANQTKYNNIFINYATMFAYNPGSVLSHELGHFFGLNHPWELSGFELKSFGLNDDNIICTNIMNYNCYVKEFTMNQLNFMVVFLRKYKYYLIK